MAKKQKRLKLRTHKAAKARLYVTGGGKLMRLKVGRSHLRRKKPVRVKRQYGQKLPVAKANAGGIKRLLPYEF